MKTTARLGLGLIGATGLALALATPAGAHVSVDEAEVPAGAYTQVTFTVPHGCEDAPTRQIAVAIPEGVLDAAPQVVAGWDVETTTTALDEPVEASHGEPQTERVSEITWTAQPGNELPSPFRQVFTVGFQAPEAEGETLVFPVIQTCTEGETAWIEETPEGGEEPEHPAPFVAIGPAEGDGHGGAAEGPTAEEASTDGATAPTGSSGDDGDDGSSDGLAIGGLVLGALGLAAGGTALLRSRPAAG